MAYKEWGIIIRRLIADCDDKDKGEKKMAHPQKLRVTKKQAIILQIKKENPDLTDLYLRREFYRVTNKALARNRLSTNVWLKQRGIEQCCKCRAWDNVENKYHLCSVCLNDAN